MAYNNIDFIIDFETMATNSNAIVLNMAFIPFERLVTKSFQEYVDAAFFYKFHLDSQVKEGRDIEPGTMDWWQEQNKDLRDRTFNPSSQDMILKDFVQAFKEDLETSGVGKFSIGYCRGQSFDFPIMADIVRKYSEENPAMFPCAFWNQRDIRSIIAGVFCDPTVTKLDVECDGFEKHDAVHDCAKAIVEIKTAMDTLASV